MTNVVDPGTPGAVKVTVWNLEMESDPGLEIVERNDLSLIESVEPAPELARFFYTEVGRDFNWRGRTSWTRDQWSQEAARPTNHLWSCWRNGTPVGYFVLDEHSEGRTGNTELKYFGLLPGFHGEGIGSWLLSTAVATAWSLGPTTRLWLHTCSLDGPAAKPNYLARGFVEVGEEIEYQLLIDLP